MSGLFGGGKSQPAPQVKPPAPMPDDQDPAVLAAKRKALADISARGGRAATIATTAANGTPLGSSTTIAGNAIGGGMAGPGVGGGFDNFDSKTLGGQ